MGGYNVTVETKQPGWQRRFTAAYIKILVAGKHETITMQLLKQLM